MRHLLPRRASFFARLVGSSGGVAVGAGCGPGFGNVSTATIDVGAPPSGDDTAPPSSAAGVDCATGQWWTRGRGRPLPRGDSESKRMHPGRDCSDCHRQRGEGPRSTVAVTVFGALNDEDDCRGIPDVVVDILDENGAVAFSVTTNDAGNFFSRQSLSGLGAYTAPVTDEGRTAEMTTPQTDGACNHCHTAVGVEDAPGRILLP